MPVPCSRLDEANAASEFATLVADVLVRFLGQNERPAMTEPELRGLMGRFWTVVSREARARPAAGMTGELPAVRVEALAAEVLPETMTAERRADLGVPVRQLLKAFLQPAPAHCRDSYREAVGGRCRRQDPVRTRARISGVHCVDCPHWVALDTGKNVALVEQAWTEGPVAGFHAQRGVFLPEDFRALRRWAQNVTIGP